MIPLINHEQCVLCERCVRICRRHIFYREKDGISIDKEKVNYCMNCGHCAAVCPTSALSLNGQTSKNLPKLSLPDNAKETLLSILQLRRSIGAFSSKKIPREVIINSINETRYSPTARNSCDVQWIVLDTDEQRKLLLEEALPSYETSTNPITHSHYVNYLHGIDSITNNAPCIIIAHGDAENKLWNQADCTGAITELQLILLVQGIASCWAGGLLRYPHLKCLHIPEGRRIGAALMAGYPEIPINHIPQRPTPKIIFQE